MSEDRWTSLPVQSAREVTKRLGITDYPVNVAEIVRALDIRLKEVAIDSSDFDGYTTQHRMVYPLRRFPL